MNILSTKKIAFSALLAAGAVGMMSTSALAQFGGHPTKEPTFGGHGTVEPSVGKATNKKRGSSKKNPGPEYIVVDQSGRQGYTSIQQAVNDVRWGGVVMVLPGDYRENIVLNKPVSLQGDRGPGMRVRILPQKADKACLSYTPANDTYHALVSNITFDTKEMTQGAEVLNSQDNLSPESLGNSGYSKTANMSKDNFGSDSADNVACIKVSGGVFTMKDSTIDGNGSHLGPLVEISQGSATFQKNTITKGRGAGVVVNQTHSLWDRAFLVDNNITNNKLSGIELMSDSTMLATGNLVHGNLTGIRYNGEGDATIIGNKILNNRSNGIMLDHKAKQVIMRLNQIWENRGHGVKIHASGGLIESNDIRVPVGYLEIDQREARHLNMKIENDVGVNRGTKSSGKSRRNVKNRKVKDNLTNRDSGQNVDFSY